MTIDIEGHSEEWQAVLDRRKKEAQAMADYDPMTMIAQTGLHAAMAREKFARVLGDSFTLISGKGREYLLHPDAMKETYEFALKQCPQAADTIACLLWHRIIEHSRLHHLAQADEDLSNPFGRKRGLQGRSGE